MTVTGRVSSVPLADCFLSPDPPDETMAVRNARDLYTRRAEGVSIWVVRASDITSSDPDAKGEFFESPQGKEYRHATYYTESEQVPHL